MNPKNWQKQLALSRVPRLPPARVGESLGTRLASIPDDCQIHAQYCTADHARIHSEDRKDEVSSCLLHVHCHVLEGVLGASIASFQF